MCRQVIVLLSVATLLAGCPLDEPIVRDVRIDNIQRILMHEPGHYTIYAESPGDPTLHEHRLAADPDSVLIIRDVPTNQSLWAMVRTSSKGGTYNSFYQVRTLTLHVHSAQDINSAGWDHGKFGRGETTVVE